ncbi:hypothetical protein [Vibrio owensii]|uniref:hypothetical protein n=1 Tax=Vibrio owensii TaxID=696485 RepID=UPI0013CEC313|nr:hypothetical protein [Vibrio owensii]
MTIQSDVKNDLDDFDILYKYACAPRSDNRLRMLRYHDNVFSEVESIFRVQFKEELKAYITDSSTLSNNEVMAYFEHPCSIVADILFEKGHKFVSLAGFVA